MRARRIQGRLAVPLALAVLTGAGVAVAVASVGTDPAASGAERTVTAATGVVQSTVSGSGNLAPSNELDLSFGASGEVTKIYVKPGEHVSQGELLATIDPSSAEVDLAEAKATLQSAQDTLVSAQAGGSSTVSAPAAQPTIRTIALTAQAAQDVPATTTPEATTTTATTPAPATTTTSTPKAKATTTQAAPASSAAPAAPAAGAGSASGTSIASATAALESAKLSVTKAERALAATKLHAPLAGTIAAVNGAVGDSVDTGTSSSSSSTTADAGSAAAVAGGLGGGGSSSSSTGSGSTSGSSGSGFVTLVQLSRYAMDVSLSESDVGKVKVGQQATVTVNAVSGAQFAARVQHVGVLSSSSTSSSAVSYPVTLRLTQTGTKLKAGMSAAADIVVGEASGVTVPSQAVSGSTVTVVRNGTRTTQRVQTGVVGDSSTQILSGLKAGDTVVVRSASAAAGANAAGANVAAGGAGQAAGAARAGFGGGGFGGGGGGGGFGGAPRVNRGGP